MITLQQAAEEHKQLNNNQKYKVFKFMLYGFYGHSITYGLSEFLVENLNRVLVLGTTVFEAYNVFYSINNVVMSAALAYFLFMDYSWLFRRVWPPYIIGYLFHNVLNLYNYKNEYRAGYFDGKQAADIDVQFKYCKFIVHPFTLTRFCVAISAGLVATLLSIKISYKLKKFYDTQNMENQLMWNTLPDQIEQNIPPPVVHEEQSVTPVERVLGNPIKLQRSETFEGIYNRPASQMPNPHIGEHKLLAELKQDFVEKSLKPIRPANRVLEPTEPKTQMAKSNSMFNMQTGRPEVKTQSRLLEEPKRLTKSTTCASIYNQTEPQSKMIKSQTLFKLSDMNAILNLNKSAHCRKTENLSLNQPPVEQSSHVVCVAHVEKPSELPLQNPNPPNLGKVQFIKQYWLEADVNQIHVKRKKSFSAARVVKDDEACSTQIGWQHVNNDCDASQTNYSRDFQQNEESQSIQEYDSEESIGAENLSRVPY